MNCNFILRYIIIICLLITVIVILYKINNYKKTINNSNNCELIEYEWNLEDWCDHRVKDMTDNDNFLYKVK